MYNLIPGHTTEWLLWCLTESEGLCLDIPDSRLQSRSVFKSNDVLFKLFISSQFYILVHQHIIRPKEEYLDIHYNRSKHSIVCISKAAFIQVDSPDHPILKCVCITFCRVRHGDSVTKPDYYYYYYYYYYILISVCSGWYNFRHYTRGLLIFREKFKRMTIFMT